MSNPPPFLDLLTEEISMPQVILKRFETPDEVISFEKGRFEKITLRGFQSSFRGHSLSEPLSKASAKWRRQIGNWNGDFGGRSAGSADVSVLRKKNC
jgi:hypothetical protein